MVVRIPMIVVGYVSAAFAVGIVYASVDVPALLTGDPALGTLKLSLFAQIAIKVTAQVAFFAAVPSAIVLAFAEVSRWRSAVFYVIAAPVVTVISLGVFHWAFLLANGLDRPIPDVQFGILGDALWYTSVAIVGAASGSIYWAVAGRNAGGWRRAGW